MRALLVTLLLAATAHAQTTTVSYRVKQKDTLDLIAAEFYGDRQHAIFIVTENKLKDRKTSPVQRLRIPVTREIVTEKGDTFESLAEQYLGDKRRAPILAEFNEADVGETPAMGTRLSIPFQVTHVAQANETLSAVASEYLDDSKQGEFLRKYNFLDKTALEKGDSVLVPVLTLKTRAGSQLDADAKARYDEHRTAMAQAEVALPNARAAWLQGDFAHVKALLEPFAERSELLDMRSAVDLQLLLGKAHIAFNETAAAVAAFKHVLERKPSHRLSTYSESPKVIDAWKRAGGQLSE